MDENNNGWKEWSKHVLLELERLNALSLVLEAKIEKINIDVTILKVKAGMWGALLGALTGLGSAVAIYLLTQH